MTALTKTMHLVNETTWAPRRRLSPLTIAFLACLALAVVAVLCIAINPAVDASALAGLRG